MRRRIVVLRAVLAALVPRAALAQGRPDELALVHSLTLRRGRG